MVTLAQEKRLFLYFEDGTPISLPGHFEHPVEFVLRLDLNEIADGIRLYTEADDGYEAYGVVARTEGQTSIKWALAPDDDDAPGQWEDWDEPLELGTVGAGAERVYFWIRARATDDEAIHNDVTVVLDARGVAGAVD